MNTIKLGTTQLSMFSVPQHGDKVIAQDGKEWMVRQNGHFRLTPFDSAIVCHPDFVAGDIYASEMVRWVNSHLS